MSKKNRKRRRDEEPEEEDILNEEEDEEEDDDLDEEEDDEEEEDEDDLDDEEDEDDLDDEGDEEDEEEDDYSDDELEGELNEGDVDDENTGSEDDEDEVYTFTVQYDGIDGDGVPRKPGDTVRVACKNCALYQKEWAGAIHCDKGKIVNDNECQPNKFSCLAYFWPFDCGHLLDKFLAMSASEVLLVNRMRIGMRRVLGGPVGGKGSTGWTSHREWVEEWAQKQGLEIDADASWTSALNFMKQFETYDQIDFPYEFFDTYAKKVKSKIAAEKKRRGKPRGFLKGDMVEWTNRDDGARLRGMVFPLGGKGSKGKIRVVVITEDHDLTGAFCDFVVEEWKRDCDPKVVVESKTL